MLRHHAKRRLQQQQPMGTTAEGRQHPWMLCHSLWTLTTAGMMCLTRGEAESPVYGRQALHSWMRWCRKWMLSSTCRGRCSTGPRAWSRTDPEPPLLRPLSPPPAWLGDPALAVSLLCLYALLVDSMLKFTVSYFPYTSTQSSIILLN